MAAVLPDHLLRKLHPRRAVPGSVPRPMRNPIEALSQKLGGKFIYEASIAKGVESSVTPELAPMRRAAHELVRNATREGMRDASLEVLAAFACMARGLDMRLPVIPALVEARGVADTVEIELLALDLMLDAAQGSWTNEVHLVRGRSRYFAGGERWSELRAAVCAASGDDYAAARERAAALRDRVASVDRSHLAFAFPDEPWSDEDLRAGLADASIEAENLTRLLGGCHDAELVRACLARRPRAVATYALDIAVSIPEDDAIEILAESLPALLQKPGYGPLHKTPPRDVATALACFKTPAAAARLAPYAGHAILGAIVADYFQGAPELLEVLTRGATNKAARGVAERVVAQVTARAQQDEGSFASPDEIPAVLRDRPWRVERPDSSGTVDGVTLLAGIEERLELPSTAVSLEAHVSKPLRAMTDAEVESHLADCKSGKHFAADYTYRSAPKPVGWEYLRVPDAVALKLWNERGAYLSGGPLAFLVRHGLAALPGFVANDRLRNLDYEGADEEFAALESLCSPRIAPVFARVAAVRKRHRRRAFAWLRAHPELAALGLIPNAVGPAGATRVEAEDALTFLAESGAGDVVRDVAGRYGVEVARVIDALLARDPLTLGVEAPKAPAFLRPDDLPAVCLRNGARLPPKARDALVELLRICALDSPYAGLTPVRAACDEASLAGLAAALLEQWLLAGAPGRHEWMLHAAVWFPSDETTRRLAELARDWARREKTKAARVCAALAALGSDLALLHLGHIAETSRFADLRQTVSAHLREAASARGLTRDELEDRTVPDLGLDADGSLRVSFGERRFVASLDPSLSLVVRDADGKILGSLPRKTKDDDAALAKAALERLKALRADATSIAARQIRRLERAMVERRTIAVADFRARFAGHPVVLHLCRGLVWEALEGGAERAFRIAEDGSPADVNDAEFALDDGARVRVAHPLTLGREAVAAWSEIFADYEVIQPFQQLVRTTYTCTDAERDASSSLRMQGVSVEAKRLLGTLESRDFERDSAGSIGAYRRAVRSEAGRVMAEIRFSPGIEIAYLGDSGAQTLGELTLRGPEGTRFGALDPVGCSELFRDLESLR